MERNIFWERKSSEKCPFQVWLMFTIESSRTQLPHHIWHDNNTINYANEKGVTHVRSNTMFFIVFK